MKTITVIALLALSSLAWAQKTPLSPLSVRLSPREKLLYKVSLNLTPEQSKSLNITPAQKQRLNRLDQKYNCFFHRICARYARENLGARIHYTSAAVMEAAERKRQTMVRKWQIEMDSLNIAYVKERVAIYTQEQCKKLVP
ncbi:MAG: hypothetical protein QM758_13910 [Armatimonas sp.]